ncbi:MAG: hypothetical protein J7J72_08830 [Bacteroidales bacterium]|nr:hypothetical protein [Bacteroidales bacterium]
MDDIIYGLLIIAWIGYGIYSATKKNKAKAESQKTSRPSTTPSANLIGSVFGSLFQEESPNPLSNINPYSTTEDTDENTTIDVSEHYQKETEDYEELDYLDVIPNPVVESKIDTYSGTDNVQQSIAVEEKDEIKKYAIGNNNLGSEITDSTAFDLCQSIIAQAILERPYK